MSGSVFKFDSSTLAAIAKIREQLGAKDDAEAIQKALLIAKMAITKSDSQNILTVVQAGAHLAESAGLLKIDLNN
jgi:hypothetical protein